MFEVLAIKEQLNKQGVCADVEMLRKAILLPEELQMQPSLKVYPRPDIGLMENPHKKVAKKGKKGKKKGKK